MSVSRFEEPFDKFLHFARCEAAGRAGQNAKIYRMVPQSGERAPTGHRGSKTAGSYFHPCFLWDGTRYTTENENAQSPMTAEHKYV